MTKIKICGLTRIEDIAAVNRLLPDYIGFVFAASRRQVSTAQARQLKAGLDARIQAVGVFVNETIDHVAALCEDGTIQVVQLHGDEGEDYLHELKQRVTCPVIKAVRVQSPEQILQAQKLPCDLLLLDTYQPGQYGGSGQTLDLSLIPPLYKPFFIAGGLDPGNIARVVRKCHPYGVDVSSGVETDGIKDETKIRQIIATIRNLSDRKELLP